ncbi:MAG: zf-HC2 domain-containing protein [Candidatus Tectomicrobia bacterium]|nr:zf-HC2 domain-containing protein [Candidatus Tectomicrobia bacterium]
MMCDQPKIQLYLYLDGELSPSDAVDVEQHLQTCQVCQAEAAAHHRLQTLLQVALPDEDVPEHLWSSIVQQLPKDEPADAAPVAHRWSGKAWWGSGVAVAALVLVTLAVKVWFANSAPIIVREMVDSQIRAQLMHTAYDQVAADTGAIRRWFDGQVEFAPPLPAILSETYQFEGVRLNYFLDRRVAEIAYRSQNHVLDFLMFARKNLSLTTMSSRRMGDRTFYIHSYKGYNTVLWQDGEIFCSLVSDLQLSEILRVAREATGI